jgi:hypothetical protein
MSISKQQMAQCWNIGMAFEVIAGKNPLLGTALAGKMRLCEIRADMYADRILDLMDGGDVDFEAWRTKIERLKERAAEVAPWKYGDADPGQLFTVAYPKVADRFMEARW